ncbi:hypothetical protein [Nocardia xishanensis]
MTGPASSVRVKDLPAQQAELLQRVHQLAVDGAQRSRALRSVGADPAASARLLGELAQIDRQRELTEIQARSSGVAPDWVEQARQTGRAGHAWNEQQRLRTPARHQGSRKSIKRVSEDHRQLTEMAAVIVAREHLLHAHGITSEPEPAAAQQLRRNMEALRTRASHTATAIGMNDGTRARTFTVSDEHLKQRVEHYLHYPLGDLNAPWRSHATPAIAASVRRSLASLRRGQRGTAPPGTEPSTAQPVAANELIERARNLLPNAGIDPADTGQAIEAAITAALGEQIVHDDPAAELDAPGSDSIPAPAHPDAGPDP